MKDHKPNAEITSIKTVFNGFLSINELEIKADRHEGGEYTVKRLVMERGHAVAVLAYDPLRDEVVLVNELRPGILAAGEYPFTNTLPAGGIAKGEKAVDAAIRETVEETGLELKNTRVLHEGAFVSAGGTSEKIAIVFGTVDTTHAGGFHGNVDEQEDILVKVMKSADFFNGIKDGSINDLKTMVAGYWLQENKVSLLASFRPKAADKGMHP